MSSQVLPQQDFFMYIPELQEVTKQSMYNHCPDVSVKCHQGLPSAPDNWVKIPLEGTVTVYAHVWNAEEEDVVA